MSKSRHSRITNDEEPRRRRPHKPISARAEINQQLNELGDLLASNPAVAGDTTPVLVYSSGDARIRHYEPDGRTVSTLQALADIR